MTVPRQPLYAVPDSPMSCPTGVENAPNPKNDMSSLSSSEGSDPRTLTSLTPCDCHMTELNMAKTSDDVAVKTDQDSQEPERYKQ